MNNEFGAAGVWFCLFFLFLLSGFVWWFSGGSPPSGSVSGLGFPQIRWVWWWANKAFVLFATGFVYLKQRCVVAVLGPAMRWGGSRLADVGGDRIRLRGVALGHDSSSAEGVIGKGAFTVIGVVWPVIGDPALDSYFDLRARSLSCQRRLAGDVLSIPSV